MASYIQLFVISLSIYWYKLSDHVHIVSFAGCCSFRLFLKRCRRNALIPFLNMMYILFYTLPWHYNVKINTNIDFTRNNDPPSYFCMPRIICNVPLRNTIECLLSKLEWNRNHLQECLGSIPDRTMTKSALFSNKPMSEHLYRRTGYTCYHTNT